MQKCSRYQQAQDTPSYLNTDKKKGNSTAIMYDEAISIAICHLGPRKKENIDAVMFKTN